MIIVELYKRYKFCMNADRLGPDILFTHWRLHFKSTMLKLCKKKFMFFDKSAEIRPGVYIDYCSRIKIGKNVILRPTTMLFGNKTAIIDLQDNVMLGSGVHIYTGNHRFKRIDIPIIEQGSHEYKNVVVKEGAWIGANSIILTGVTIGKNSVVGAGSVVTKDVPDFSVVVGNPARVIKKLDKNNQNE